ncbi:hypothetical protein [Cognatiyoonia sp. IB215182]|uniref:hypothetical protein n=1 Tax=Cognatiyoonia sp. IB215182 TaxID=3097353 RepID=UPI002A114C12|nr:hypothetical protein [Cognatiyoonia sp. IB215182]MDX8354334.1 hypothetical protein [Cognatiyoonia sp. IB215182]
MKRSRINITDHAILRYIERVMEIDVDAVRSSIAATIAVADEHPTCIAVTKDGFRYVLVGDTLVTIRRITRAAGHKSKAKWPSS